MGGVAALARVLAEPYRLLHLTGHGAYEYAVRLPGQDDAVAHITGFVLDGVLFLTAAEVSQMRSAPEVVFLNASYLGRAPASAFPSADGADATARSLPEQFLSIGTRAVIAPAGPIEDAPAVVFAEAFYSALFDGDSLGEAVLRARRAAHAAAPNSITWGMYLAFGDPEYRLELPAPAAGPKEGRPQGSKRARAAGGRTGHAR